MSEKLFLTAADIANILGMSKPYCYKIISKLNKELEDKGFMTVQGKVSKIYFEEKFYGIKEDH